MASIYQELGIKYGSARCSELAGCVSAELEAFVLDWLTDETDDNSREAVSSYYTVIAETVAVTAIARAVEILGKDHRFTKRQADESFTRYLQIQNLNLDSEI
jgi:P2-related tail formation protein